MKMGHTGVELFMEKLKNMIYSNDNPLITNQYPSILYLRPQFKLLYEELDSVTKTFHLIDDKHHELQKVSDLKQRFKDAAQDAHDIIDLFVYHVNLGNQIYLNQVSVNHPPASQHDIDRFKPSEETIHLNDVMRSKPRTDRLMAAFEKIIYMKDAMTSKPETDSLVSSFHDWLLTPPEKDERIYLKDVMRSIKTIKKEFNRIHDKLKLDSFPRSDPLKTPSSAAAGPSCTKSSLGTKKASEDIVVGFDLHAELIRDKLAEDQKQLDVVSIVGTGGVGKSTLATKVFNDPFVMYHFHIRGWVTVSQRYEKQDLIIQILESIGNKIDNVRDQEYSQLRQLLRQKLMRKRYLIVIDDIWSNEAWDDLKLSLPDDHTGSRILLTSRSKEVVMHAKSHGFIHQLEYLTEEESWELLCNKVFHGNNDCPKWMIKYGMHIARNCHGLPLTLVVVAGVLAKDISKESWERISQRVSSYMVNDHTEYLETLALSIDHLPGNLRDCFLYLGGFPEDHKFRVRSLIWLWIAEGLIPKDDGHRSLEEIGENSLMELVDRNLVVVADRKSNGGIKSFYVHDLLRELCLKIATKENFYLKAKCVTHLVEAYTQRRIFVEHDIAVNMNTPRIRSLLCVYRLHGTRNLISKWSHNWNLLMVLDLRGWRLDYFPEEISRLCHLRYLAILYYGDEEFPSSICKLWSLQTLIIKTYGIFYLELPMCMSDLVNLRHLKCEGNSHIRFPAIQKPMNLQTISRVVLGDGAESWVKCFPGIKKLSCNIQTYMEGDLQSLNSLEKLWLSGYWYLMRGNQKVIGFGFPVSLKSLTLEHCNVPWSDMSIIQLLPNLEVLKLLSDSFVGPRWDGGEEQFLKLKFFKLSNLEIQEWEASDINFPCLKQLVVECCKQLEEIPSEIGYIPTLELISISDCNDSVVESLDTLKQEQHAQGNFELKISIKINMEI